MSALLTTDSIVPADRVDWWRERVIDIFGAAYNIEPDKGGAFHIGVEMECAEHLALLKIRGSAHHAKGQSDPGEDSKLLVHLQVKGHCTVRAEGRETLLEPLSLALFPIRESTDLRFHDSYEQVCVVLPVSVLAKTYPNWVHHSATCIPTEQGTAAVLADHLLSLARHSEALHQCGSALANLTVGLIGSVLHELSDKAPKDTSGLKTYHLERIKQYALLHLSNPALDINFISKGVNLSVRYIHRLFQYEPQTLMHWILKERLYRCHAELTRGTSSNRTICEIAYTWGFNDQAHFTHSFRRQFGITPSDVRTSKGQKSLLNQ